MYRVIPLPPKLPGFSIYVQLEQTRHPALVNSWEIIKDMHKSLSAEHSDTSSLEYMETQ